MLENYQQQRVAARQQYMRTVLDEKRAIFSLNDGHLQVDIPPRLDYLVTELAIREANAFNGRVTSLEVRMHQTEYLDSAGMGFLLVLRGLLPQGSAAPALSGVSAASVLRPLQVGQFDKLFVITTNGLV